MILLGGRLDVEIKCRMGIHIVQSSCGLFEFVWVLLCVLCDPSLVGLLNLMQSLKLPLHTWHFVTICSKVGVGTTC